MDPNHKSGASEHLTSPGHNLYQDAGDVTNNYNATHHYDYYKYYDIDGDYWASYDYEEHIYEIFDFEYRVYGYLWPILVLIITSCNLLVVCGFLRRRMRNPTNTILVSIAITDSLTGLVTLPATIHVFSQHNMELTKEWCEVTMISRLYISRAFHTISVWQTLLLGIYRLLQVRYPVSAQRFCSMRNTAIIIGCLYIAAFVLHIYHAFDVKTENGLCNWVVEEECGWTCVYIWCTLLFSHLLPCFLLIVLTYCLIQALKTLKSREALQGDSQKKSEKVRNLTIVVILIVVIFLVPELPYGIFYLTVVSLRHNKKDLFPFRTNRMIHCIYEILLLVSFHLNFWVYCALVRSFRSSIKTVLAYVTCHKVAFSRLEGETTSSSGRHLELHTVRQVAGDRNDTEVLTEP